MVISFGKFGGKHPRENIVMNNKIQHAQPQHKKVKNDSSSSSGSGSGNGNGNGNRNSKTTIKKQRNNQGLLPSIDGHLVILCFNHLRVSYLTTCGYILQ